MRTQKAVQNKEYYTNLRGLYKDSEAYSVIFPNLIKGKIYISECLVSTYTLPFRLYVVLFSIRSLALFTFCWQENSD